MSELRTKLSNREILWNAGGKAQVMVSMDLANKIGYNTLLEIKNELDGEGLVVSITNRGITFSVNRNEYQTAQSIVSRYGTDISDSDFYIDDGDSAGRSNVTENKR